MLVWLTILLSYRNLGLWSWLYKETEFLVLWELENPRWSENKFLRLSYCQYVEWLSECRYTASNIKQFHEKNWSSFVIGGVCDILFSDCVTLCWWCDLIEETWSVQRPSNGLLLPRSQHDDNDDDDENVSWTVKSTSWHLTILYATYLNWTQPVTEPGVWRWGGGYTKIRTYRRPFTSALCTSLQIWTNYETHIFK